VCVYMYVLVCIMYVYMHTCIYTCRSVYVLMYFMYVMYVSSVCTDVTISRHAISCV
jgi:hypothetical protein